MTEYIIAIVGIWLLLNLAILAHCLALDAEAQRRERDWHDA